MVKRISVTLLACLLCLGLTLPCLAESQATAATVMYDDSQAMYNNIDLAIDALDGATVSSGKTFSFNAAVGPRTKARGYQAALNGRGVKVIGGGVAQVATTLYMALTELDAEIKMLEKHTYGRKFAWNYADVKEAILVDYKSGKDLRFRNKAEQDLKIAMRREGVTLYCTAYYTEGEEPEEPDDPIEGPDVKPDEEEAKLYKVYRCKEYINLRKTASTSAKSMAQIPLDATVLMLDQGNKLHKVRYDGKTGYVNKQYVKAVPESRVRKVSKCDSYISLRDEPSTKAKRLSKLPLGTLVEYIGKAEDGFAEVQFEEMRGYVLVKYLTKE